MQYDANANSPAGSTKARAGSDFSSFPDTGKPSMALDDLALPSSSAVQQDLKCTCLARLSDVENAGMSSGLLGKRRPRPIPTASAALNTHPHDSSSDCAESRCQKSQQAVEGPSGKASSRWTMEEHERFLEGSAATSLGRPATVWAELEEGGAAHPHAHGNADSKSRSEILPPAREKGEKEPRRRRSSTLSFSSSSSVPSGSYPSYFS